MNKLKVYLTNGGISEITAELLPIQAQVIVSPAGNILEVRNATGQIVAEVPFVNVSYIESDLQTATNG